MSCVWPNDLGAEAVVALGRSLDFGAPPERPRALWDAVRWLEDEATRRGRGVELFELPLRDLSTFLEGAAPFVLQAPSGLVVGLRPTERGTFEVLAPGGAMRVASDELDRALRPAQSVPEMLDGLSPPDRERFLRAIELEGRPCVVVHLPLREASSPTRAASALTLPRWGAGWSLLAMLQLGASALSLRALSDVALDGRTDRGALVAFVLFGALGVVVQAVIARYTSAFSIRASSLVRQRLLEGTLASDPDGLGPYGAGGLMAIAGQCEHLLGGLITTFLSMAGLCGNLVASIVLLTLMPGSTFALLAFVSASVILGAFALALRRALRRANVVRLRTSTDFVERMVGHRTRLVQQTPNSWHEGEDALLIEYAEYNELVDVWRRRMALVPRIFVLVLAAPLLLLTLLDGGSPVSVGLVMGGTLFGASTLAALSSSMTVFAGLGAVLGVARELLTTERKTLDRDTDSAPTTGRVAVELRGVGFSYSPSDTVLEDVSFRIERGEHLLLEGASGSGKTTLASVMAGLRVPSRGTLLIGGADARSLDLAQHRRVVAYAPQFHRNHVFSDSLAFNVLLGRRWPPVRRDLEDAEECLHELGLGPLLERMPAGIHQHVGENGWQLSHGERSRIFLARAILQDAAVVILDESFGTLDPESLERCMAAVRERVDTLVVITQR